jgi:hypothetical protein
VPGVGALEATGVAPGADVDGDVDATELAGALVEPSDDDVVESPSGSVDVVESLPATRSVPPAWAVNVTPSVPNDAPATPTVASARASVRGRRR